MQMPGTHWHPESLVGLVMQSTGRGDSGLTCLNLTSQGPSFCGSPVIRLLYHWTATHPGVTYARIMHDTHAPAHPKLPTCPADGCMHMRLCKLADATMHGCSINM